MTPVGISCEIRVVFEQMDRAAYPLLVKTRFSADQEIFKDSLPGLVLRHDVAYGVAFCGGVFRMGSHIEIKAGSILEEDI